MVLQTERYNGGYQQQGYQGSNGAYNSHQSVTDYSTPHSNSFQVSTYPYHQSGWSDGGDYYGNGANHRQGVMGGPAKPPNGGYGGFYKEKAYTPEHSDNHGNSHHQSHVSLHDSHHQGHGSPHGQIHGGSRHQGHESPHGQIHGGSRHQGHESPHDQVHGGSHHQGHGSHHGLDHEGSHHQGHDSYLGLDHGGSHLQNHGISHGQGYGGSPHGIGKTHGGGGVITHQINKLAHGYNNYENCSPNYGHNPSGFNHGYQKPSWIIKGLDDDDDE